MLILPLTFASSVFAPPSSMPGWLQAFVKVNPITKVVDATRGLMLGGSAVARPLLISLAGLIGIVAVFAPLAINRYGRGVLPGPVPAALSAAHWPRRAPAGV